MKAEILYILEPHSIQGYWPGYDAIVSELDDRFDIQADVGEVKDSLKDLYQIGAVELRPIFKNSHNGKLNGSGYFVIEKDELKNYSENLTHHQDARRYIGIELYGRW